MPILRTSFNRRELLGLLAAGIVHGQAPAVEWVCPMDPDVRSSKQDRCRKCGMTLVAGLPTPEEFPVAMTVVSKGSDVSLTFRITDPKTGKPARLQLIHEKLFHLFLISRDLSTFRHEHPELQPDGSFIFRTSLPTGGMYRVLCDFYPENATPQLIPKTILLPGQSSPAALRPDVKPQKAANVTVGLRMEPEKPLAGTKTMLFFELNPADGLEQYLGAWGHMLVASEDLIDLIHSHPAWEEGGPKIQFNVILPRPGMHRVWVQFQRRGVVNTAAFNVEVSSL